MSTSELQIFEQMESEVRGYVRSFPVLFERAAGCELFATGGRRYLDFFAGAGALNYGHNEPRMAERLIAYLRSGGPAHSLDMATSAKAKLLETLRQVVLEPRGLDYKVQFPGPTGTNAVESALKLARKATGRSNVVTFTNAFHGMTLGSLAVTGNSFKRAGAGVNLSDVTALPFDGYVEGVDSLQLLEAMLEDAGSGVDRPAAVILETVQAEGGVRVARYEWLQRLAKLLRRHDVLLIVDDIQVGCGRTGPFFSFEAAELQPDIVCLSKSISGFGLPMALVLMKPHLDVWEPGEHNGTFRGHNLAFVTATAALELYWRDGELSQQVAAKADLVEQRLRAILQETGVAGEWRGRGLIQGLAFDQPELASEASQQAFERGLVIETAGPQDEVLKLLPALVISEEQLREGLDIVHESIAAAASSFEAKAA